MFEELDALLAEENELQERQIQVQQEIAKRTQKIAQVASACEEDLNPRSMAARLVRTLREGGLSEAIRRVYKASKTPLTVVDVHNQLKAINYPLASYHNVLATLHLTIKRLTGQLELLPVIHEGKKAFKWNTSPIRGRMFESEAVKKALQDAIHPPSSKLSDLGRPQKPRPGIDSLKKKD